MQTMCLDNNSRLILLFMALLSVAANHAVAGLAMQWAESKAGRVSIGMVGGSVYRLAVPDEVKGVFYDADKHKVKGGLYISVFQVSPSNPGKPEGFCGAGSEIWLHVYKVAGSALSEQLRVQVSSCLHTVSMASQNTGVHTQDFDFSSVQWNAEGFSIDWFEKVDLLDRPLSSTRYSWRDNQFLPLDSLANPDATQ